MVEDAAADVEAGFEDDAAPVAEDVAAVEDPSDCTLGE